MHCNIFSIVIFFVLSANFKLLCTYSSTFTIVECSGTNSLKFFLFFSTSFFVLSFKYSSVSEYCWAWVCFYSAFVISSFNLNILERWGYHTVFPVIFINWLSAFWEMWVFINIAFSDIFYGFGLTSSSLRAGAAVFRLMLFVLVVVLFWSWKAVAFTLPSLFTGSWDFYSGDCLRLKLLDLKKVL